MQNYPLQDMSCKAINCSNASVSPLFALFLFTYILKTIIKEGYSVVGVNCQYVSSNLNFIRLKQMLTVYISILTVALAQYQTSSCLLIQHVTVQDSSNMVQGSTYNFPITWNSTQTGLGAGALALGGFQVTNFLCFLSYDASLVNVTTTGAVIVFEPLHSGTDIVLMQFDIVIGKTSCSTYLEVVSQTFATSVINVASRNQSSQNFLVSHSTVAASATLKVYAYFQAYTMTTLNPARNIYMRIDSADNQNNGTVLVTVESATADQNVVTSVTLTVIIAEQSSFASTVFIDTLDHDAPGRDVTSVDSPTFMPMVLSPGAIKAQWCIMGVFDIRGYAFEHTNSPKATVRAFDGFNVNYTAKNLEVANHFFTCILECETAASYQLDVPTSPYSCYICGTAISGCRTCNSSSICAETCSATVTGCTSCDSAGTCLTCASGAAYAPDTCQCSQDTKCTLCGDRTTCTTCNSLSNLNGGSYCQLCSALIADCLECSSASVCDNCSTGYFINVTFKCDPCTLSNCDDCVSATNCSTCASGFVLNSTFQCETCASAISDCLTCASASVCSVCASTHVLNNANSTCDLCALSNCATCATTTVCSVCDSGFVVSSGNCVTSSSGDSSDENDFPLVPVVASVSGVVLAALVIVIVVCLKKRGEEEIAVQQPSMSHDKLFSQKEATGPEKITVGGKSYPIDSTQIIQFQT